MKNAGLKFELDQLKSLISSNHLDFAQFECTRVVSEHPGEVQPLCLMSYILYLQSRFKDSSRYALLAADAAAITRDWRDILSASNALLMNGEDQMANQIMELIENLSLLDTEHIEIIAKQFGKLDQLEKAVEVFNMADVQRMNYHSWQMFGVANLYLGNEDSALECFEKAIQKDPNDCISYNQISSLRVSKGRDERILKLIELEKSQDLSPLNLSYLHFALFNELDAKDDRGEAFSHLGKANAVRRSMVNYDSIRERSLYESIVHQYADQEFAPAHPVGATPIFIVGMPRTGTTLLEKIIGRYTGVYSCGELNTLRLQLQSSSGVMLRQSADIGDCQSLLDLNYAEIGSEYFRKVSWRIGDALYFTDKHPSNHVFLGMIAKAIPHARIIHITKNPMDACFSNFKQLFSAEIYTYSYSQQDLIQHYLNYRYLMSFWEMKLPRHVLNVKYEDLVLDPDGQAERIGAFCGLSETHMVEKQFVTNTLSASQIRKPVHTKNINAWAKYAEFLKPLREQLNDEYVTYMSAIEGVEIL